MPTRTTVYEPPSVPSLLTLSSFLYLLNLSDALFSRLLHAGLLGPLLIGVLFGPQASNLLPADVQSAFTALGYLGLVLLVFDAGLASDPARVLADLALSSAAALTGVLLPIALSLAVLHGGFGYAPLPAFAAGAALCSTSLGTALALLDAGARATRAGAVLTSAALLDDVAGLVIAAVIAHLSSGGGDGGAGGARGIPWRIVVRPVLVSFGFGLGTPVLAWAGRQGMGRARGWRWVVRAAGAGGVQALVLMATLTGFVACAAYAGTSELFGAYLAGAFLTHVAGHGEEGATPHEAFGRYVRPALVRVLAPVFFGSVGAALPIRSLVSVHGSRAVVWRGVVYGVAMVVAKAVVGLWMLVWPEGGCVGKGRQRETASDGGGFSKRRSAMLLGTAMVARGEIALIVAQLARPLLVSSNDDQNGDQNSVSEPFAVVIWAILITTIVGAIGVGLILRGRT